MKVPSTVYLHVEGAGQTWAEGGVGRNEQARERRRARQSGKLMPRPPDAPRLRVRRPSSGSTVCEVRDEPGCRARQQGPGRARRRASRTTRLRRSSHDAGRERVLPHTIADTQREVRWRGWYGMEGLRKCADRRLALAYLLCHFGVLGRPRFDILEVLSLEHAQQDLDPLPSRRQGMKGGGRSPAILPTASVQRPNMVAASLRPPRSPSPRRLSLPCA